MGWRRRPKAAFLIEALETRLLLSADLAVHETGPPSVQAAGTVSYNVTLTNLGPSPAAGVVLNDAIGYLPANSLNANITPAASNPDSFTTGDLATGFEETAHAAIASGNVDVFVVTAQIFNGSAPVGTTCVNTVSATSTTSDPNLANNGASVTTNVITPTADLSVQETGPSSVQATGTVSYNVTLTNLGFGPAALAETDRFFSGEDALGSLWLESFDE